MKYMFEIDPSWHHREHNQDDIRHIDGYGLEHAPDYNEKAKDPPCGVTVEPGFNDPATLNANKRVVVADMLNHRDECRVRVMQELGGAEAAAGLNSEIKMERNGQMRLPVAEWRPHPVSATAIADMWDECRDKPRGIERLKREVEEVAEANEHIWFRRAQPGYRQF